MVHVFCSADDPGGSHRARGECGRGLEAAAPIARECWSTCWSARASDDQGRGDRIKWEGSLIAGELRVDALIGEGAWPAFIEHRYHVGAPGGDQDPAPG